MDMNVVKVFWLTEISRWAKQYLQPNGHEDIDRHPGN
jgi:hypothetical protein